VISIALVVGGFGCQPNQPATDNTSPPTAPVSPQPETLEPSAATKPELAVYWLTYKANQLALEPTKIPLDDLQNASSQEQLSAAFNRLLAGPANADKTNAIPQKTKLNSLKLEDDGVHIDLSKDFTIGGGTKSMQARLGQVVYTASSLNPKEAVWISIDGEPLEVLSGDGLIVSQPMTRKEFDTNFSL
jgi:spore germination protein GerM